MGRLFKIQHASSLLVNHILLIVVASALVMCASGCGESKLEQAQQKLEQVERTLGQTKASLSAVNRSLESRKSPNLPLQDKQAEYKATIESLQSEIEDQKRPHQTTQRPGGREMSPFDD